MKKVLGLDLGSNSIGWAFVEDHGDPSKNKIIKSGVRIIPMDNENTNFERGLAVTKNAERREKRSSRRNNFRRKLRNKMLIEQFVSMGIFTDVEEAKDYINSYNKTPGVDNGVKFYKTRAISIQQKIDIKDFAKILYRINQRRGYKSIRNADISEEELKDTKDSDWKSRVVQINDEIQKRKITIGQLLYERVLKKERTKGIVFLRSKYIEEFDKMWEEQSKHYPEILTEENKDIIKNRIIFYQRPLKSQKGLLSKCRFEKNLKVIPKSSPLFQVFRIYQTINNLVIWDDYGEIIELTDEQRNVIFDYLDQREKANEKQILKVLGLTPTDSYHINFERLEGNKTKAEIRKVLNKIDIKEESWLKFEPLNDLRDQKIYQLWHLLYSAEENDKLINTLTKKFGVSYEQAKALSEIKFKKEYGSLSAKAIKKLLPPLLQGLNFSQACDWVRENGEGDTSNYINNPAFDDENKLSDKLSYIKRNELRNPVVEQVINNTISIVNQIISHEEMGRPDEIRVELARELKASKKQREKAYKNNQKLRKENERIVNILKTEFKLPNPSRNDIIRYKLFEECDKFSIYTGRAIQCSDIFDTSKYDVDHIIPRSKYFDDSFNNKVLCEAFINREKSGKTAFDYMKSLSEQEFEDYIQRINKNKKLSKRKKQYLLMTEEKIPNDFITRQLKETQYIAKKVKELLKSVTPKVVSTSGAVTDFLRYNWGLNDVLRDLNLDIYRRAGLTENIVDEKNHEKEIIPEWSKREDQRHHALDAIVVAFTKAGIINRLNRLNQFVSDQNLLKEKARKVEAPMNNFNQKVKEALSEVLISYRKNNKIITKNVNKIRTRKGKIEQVTWTPRGALHKETVYGKINNYSKVKLTAKTFNINSIADKKLYETVVRLLERNNNDVNKAISELKKSGINELIVFEPKYTVKMTLDENFDKTDKIVDAGIKRIVKKRLADYGNNPKKAFADLENNPIWINKDKGIKVRSVKVFDRAKELTPIHEYQEKPVDYVYLRNNHHIALYEKPDGEIHEEVVSFYEAVQRALSQIDAGEKINVIHKNHPLGYKFLTSLEINDMFVLGLSDDEYEVLSKKNAGLISNKLYRVQKLSTKMYYFRLHTETTLAKEVKPFLIRIQSFGNGITGWRSYNPIKVKLNKLGEIVRVEK